MSLRLLHPGALSLLVDAGRPRTRHLGVPVGGAADRAAFRLGNALIGNFPAAPALEFALAGPMLLAESDVSCCVFGAPFTLRVGGVSLASGKVFCLMAGETLRIGTTPTGLRGYLCVKNGFEGQQILGSVSSLEPLKADTLLSCTSSFQSGRSLSVSVARTLLDGKEAASLRVLPGPQAASFDLHAFTSESYRVGTLSDRMGLRLEGMALPRIAEELASEAIGPGSVQITHDGQPVILGMDGQTIGGYPKIAHVIDADLDLIAQLRPGEEVRFQVVTQAEAEAANNAYRSKLRGWLARLRATSEC